MTLNDQDLIQRLQGHDEDALTALYSRYSRLVYNVAFRILRSRASAEDVLQDLFMRLWDSPQQIEVPCDTLHGWMVVASRNRSIDILRKRYPDQLGSVVITSPFELQKCSECKLMCAKALTLVSADQRIVLEMAYLQEMTHIEIASATGYPLGTIKSRIRRALKLVKKALIAVPEVGRLAPESMIPRLAASCD